MALGGCCRSVPLLHRLRPEDAERSAGDEAALQIEGVVDGGVAGKHPLRGTSGFEALQLAFASPTGWCEFSARLFWRRPCS